MDFRSTEGIFVGYEGTHQYHVWDPTNNQVHMSRDVDFISESKKLAPARINGGEAMHDTIGVLREQPIESDMDKDSSDENDEGDQDDQEDDLGTITVEPSFAPTSPERSAYSPSRGTTQGSLSLSEEDMDVRTSGRERKEPDRYGECIYPGKKKAKATVMAMLAKSIHLPMEPSSYEEAINHPTYSKE